MQETRWCRHSMHHQSLIVEGGKENSPRTSKMVLLQPTLTYYNNDHWNHKSNRVAERRSQTWNDLSDQPVQIRVGWALNVQIPAANIVERFIVIHNCHVCMLQQRMDAQHLCWGSRTKTFKVIFSSNVTKKRCSQKNAVFTAKFRCCMAQRPQLQLVGSTTLWKRSYFFCHSPQTNVPTWGSPSRIQCHHHKHCRHRTLATLSRACEHDKNPCNMGFKTCHEKIDQNLLTWSKSDHNYCKNLQT